MPPLPSHHLPALSPHIGHWDTMPCMKQTRPPPAARRSPFALSSFLHSRYEMILNIGRLGYCQSYVPNGHV